MFTVFGKLNCKEATMLASKKQEGEITLIERIKLYYHNKMCIICKRFEQQIRIISRRAKETSSDVKMPEQAKNEIKQAIKAA